MTAPFDTPPPPPPMRVPHAGPDPDPAVPPLSTVLRSPPSPRTVRLLLAAAAVAVAAVAGLLVLNGLFTPGRAAEGFFSALAHRDGSGASDWLAAEARGGTLLDPKVVRDAGYSPPTHPRVEEVHVEENGAEATARVTFQLDGQPAAANVELVRSGRRWLLFPRWQVKGGQFGAAVSAPDPLGVRMAGRPVPANVRVAAFPGSYRATLEDNPLLAASPVTVYAFPGAPEARLEPRVADPVPKAVGEQISSFLSQCARSTELAPTGCPFGVSSAYATIDVAWQIVSYPKTHLQMTENGVVLVTDGNGEAQVTYSGTYPDGTPFGRTTTSVPFSVSGPVTVENGSVRWRLETS